MDKPRDKQTSECTSDQHGKANMDRGSTCCVAPIRNTCLFR